MSGLSFYNLISLPGLPFYHLIPYYGSIGVDIFYHFTILMPMPGFSIYQCLFQGTPLVSRFTFFAIYGPSGVDIFIILRPIDFNIFLPFYPPPQAGFIILTFLPFYPTRLTVYHFVPF